MNCFSRLTLALITAAVLGGCAGTNFKRPDAGALELGKSTTAQLLEVMGPPRQSGEALRNGEKLQVFRYVFAEVASPGKYPGVTPARAMGFQTLNNVLVSEEFVSSFATDATDFDETRIGSIVKGKTTRDEVVALIGRPNGTGIYPIVKTKGHTAAIYSYAHTRGTPFNIRNYNKALIVTFDTSGIVADVEYFTNGEK